MDNTCNHVWTRIVDNIKQRVAENVMINHDIWRFGDLNVRLNVQYKTLTTVTLDIRTTIHEMSNK